MPARGSIDTGASRVSASRTRSTCAALAKARSTVAALPSVQSSATLPGRASWIGVASSASARSMFGSARQLVVIDAHRLGGVLRLRQRFRDHDRDRLADIADAVRRQHRHRGRKHRLAVAAGKHRDRRDRAEPVGRRILAAVDAEHARHRARRREIDRADRRMADRRAHEHAIGLVRHGQVVGEPAAAGQQRLVLAAQGAMIAAEACRAVHHPVRRLPLLRTATLASCGEIAGRLDTGEGHR